MHVGTPERLKQAEKAIHDAADKPTGTLFTIPQTRPFLHALAKAVLAGELPQTGGAEPDPVALTKTEILLPSRRACRALTECFVDLSKTTSILLPKIRPLGDVDEILALVSPGSPLSQQTPGATPRCART